MRTNADEFTKLGVTMAERLNAAKGPVRVLIPFEGFSEHTKLRAHDLAGNDRGPWRRPEEYQAFTDALKAHLNPAIPIDVLPLHINDVRFADACVDAFLQIYKESKPK
jgi:uncharacterized protein (UPF0261 family)